jgi:hypothetical protein
MKTIGYLVLAFLAIGCKEKVCPAYPEEYLNWMPYNKGENLCFVSGNDSLKLNVASTYRSGQHNAKPAPFNKDYCMIEARVDILDYSASQIIYQLSYYNEVSGQVSYDLSLFNHTTFATFQIKNGKITTGWSQLQTTLLDEYDNGFNKYNNVLILNIDTLNYSLSTISRIYIAESIGIIQLRGLKNHKTWSLIAK